VETFFPPKLPIKAFGSSIKTFTTAAMEARKTSMKMGVDYGNL